MSLHLLKSELDTEAQIQLWPIREKHFTGGMFAVC